MTECFKTTKNPLFIFFLFLFSLSFSLCPSTPHPHILLPHRTFYISLMMSILMIMGVIVLMMIVVSGDDTQALRDTISSLCSLNSVGEFASCCVSYDNGASLTLASSTVRACFISSLASTTGSVLTYLFVICFIFVLFLLFDDCHSFSSFFIFRSFQYKGLGVLGKDVFSSLTNLNSLFPFFSLSSIHFFLHSFPSFLSFFNNRLASLESGVFDGLNSLSTLSHSFPLFHHHLIFNLPFSFLFPL